MSDENKKTIEEEILSEDYGIDDIENDRETANDMIGVPDFVVSEQTDVEHEAVSETPASESTIVDDGNNDSYFDDDETMLKYYDESLHETTEMAIVHQDEYIVSWEILNLYDDNGNLRNRYLMKSDPPLFRISSTSGEEASFFVTKELSRTLSKLFSDVERAYYGIEPKESRKQYQDRFESLPAAVKNWVLSNKVKSVIFLLLILLAIVAIVL